MIKKAKKKSFDKLLAQLGDTLKKHSLKNTSQREIILKAMYDNDGHFTPEEVLSLSNHTQKGGIIGQATIYRTLNFFEKVGLASSISFGIDGKKYELNSYEHHDHMICVKCEKIIEFVSEEIEQIQLAIAKAQGFAMKDHAMQLYGECQECQKSTKETRA
jgi:Fur family transcriptional regulator, ferric uptake regulator